MRITLSVLFNLVLLHGMLFAQLPPNWGAFNQRIDVRPYQGRKFRIQAAVKVTRIDSSAEGEIWVRVDKTDKKMGFFYNMMDKPIRSNEWKQYSISGDIDKDAGWLSFGGLYSRKGLFYFDDFELFIENGEGNWQEIVLGEAGFEGDSTMISRSWGFTVKREGIDVYTTKTEAYTGQKSYLADASHLKSSAVYGSNDSAGAYADVNGIKMYYEIYGQGKPLILLHGNSQSIVSFYKQIPELSKHFKVIAIDSRGQGKSNEDGKKFTYELFAADTKALLDYLKIDSADILGWSDGGNTGLIMAMSYPEKVGRLAVMGAVLYNNNSSVKPWVNKQLKKEYEEIKDDSTYKSPFRKRMINLLLSEPNIDPRQLATIQCPVLVMAGSDDAVREDHTKLIAARIKKSQLVIFPQGNHMEPSERPERFNKTVLDFLMEGM